MRSYIKIVDEVLQEGEEKVGRNGMTYSITGAEFRHNMSRGFPILTIRKMSIKNALTELRFFIQGMTDKRWLQARNNHFWDKWHSKDGEEWDLGPIYGRQWRDFNGVDQLADVIKTLKTDPLSRRMLVSAWNPAEIESMALPPCHDSFQLISDGLSLDLIWRQRSCDVAIGLPYDILLYGLLLELIAKEVKMEARWLIGQLGDVHVYEPHKDGLYLLSNTPTRILPKLELPEFKSIFEFAFSDELAAQVKLTNYHFNSEISFKVIA